MKRVRSFIFGALVLMLGVTLASAEERQWTKVIIGTEGDFAPWNYIEAGKLKGLEIDLAEDVCMRTKLECTFVTLDFNTLIPSLNLGKIDAIMTGLSHTEKRAEVIGFSVPYAIGGLRLAVMKGSPLEKLPFKDDFINLNDDTNAQAQIQQMKPLLKGILIGAQTASINAAFLERYLKDVVEVRQYQAVTQHDLDLKAGRIDAVMAADSYFRNLAKQPGNAEIETVGPRIVGGVIGNGAAVGFRKTDVKLKSMFDDALKAAFADGTYKRISEKYFGYDATPKIKF